jgi:LPS sulfotransferase NodH
MQAAADPPSLFIVIGAQRTGTTLLREILNTSPDLGVLGEIMTPSPAPAHWDNFWRQNTSPGACPHARLDQYFTHVIERVRNHWSHNAKCRARAIGVDIKYNQLWRLVPGAKEGDMPEDVFAYLAARNILIIHAVRENVIHCAVSTMIAMQRGTWHNYTGEILSGCYRIDPQACLSLARDIMRRRIELIAKAAGCKLVTCRYHDLVQHRLEHIARALQVPAAFRHAPALRKAINIPYAQAISNLVTLRGAVLQSEFAAWAEDLD